jgi:1-acyl-sn-glycerol-3-phosphate acyltransferase
MTRGRRTRQATAGSYSAAWRTISKIILRPGIRLAMRLESTGHSHIPADGAVILAANHLSYADVLAVASFADSARRYPVFLAKSSLFGIPVLGRLLVKLGQLPVNRGQADAAIAARQAEAVVTSGACLIFYPEGTVTRDPQMWPMASRTGVARLAMATGAPVIAVGHWGAQALLPYRSARPRLLPRKTVQVLAGPPVDLTDFAAQRPTPSVLRAVTDKIMSDVAALVGELRGLTPPAEPFDPTATGARFGKDLAEVAETSETRESREAIEAFEASEASEAAEARWPEAAAQ